MKLNKVQLFISVWVMHMCIFHLFAFSTIMQQNWGESLVSTLESLEGYLLMAVLMTFFGIHTFIVSIIVMFFLVWINKIRFMIAYCISVFFYWVTFLIKNQNIDECIIVFVCLISTVIIVYLIFRKSFKRIDKEIVIK